jgi:indolepyruvate ferredoxin oxidoreductase
VRLLSPKTVDIAVELLSLPEQIRGYGQVKEASVVKARARYEQLAKDLADPPPMVAPQIAAE